MYVRAAAALVLIVFFAGTHWKAYVSGKQAVQAQMAQAALKAEQAYRAKEQALIASKQQVEVKYAEDKRKAAVAVSSARAELGRLRDELYAIGRAPSACTATGARVNARAPIEGELLGQCAQALTDMARKADELTVTVVGLQQYVKQVCLK
jgi:hypothetical protein